MDIAIQLTTYPGLDNRIIIIRAGDEVDAFLCDPNGSTWSSTRSQHERGAARHYR